ncbi:DUF6506 family protein [Budvicia diplopodorum]|uniref:DUF6506 family protein n=1 Tax=Budvicia diplopodorum TaxID=1119056 RepID=UPI00135B6693|nr:DUF6506 family protein [Budvicia diplopodorum]
MTDIIKAAFIFTSPKADPTIHNGWVKTEGVHLKTVAVASYQQGCDILDDLYEEGIRTVELCAGFGHQGVALMVKAAKGRMQVGVVRFDTHPLMGFCSGDSRNNGITGADAAVV